MDTNPYSTATMTKTVSGTKLLAATLALYAVGGVSLATVPLAKSTTLKATTPVVTIEASCSGDTVYLSGRCTATYNGFTATCQDGRRFTQTLSSCKTSSEIAVEAKVLCTGRRNPRSGKVGLNGYSVGKACETTYRSATAGDGYSSASSSTCFTARQHADMYDGAIACGESFLTFGIDSGLLGMYPMPGSSVPVFSTVQNLNDFDVSIKKIRFYSWFALDPFTSISAASVRSAVDGHTFEVVEMDTSSSTEVIRVLDVIKPTYSDYISADSHDIRYSTYADMGDFVILSGESKKVGIRVVVDAPYLPQVIREVQLGFGFGDYMFEKNIEFTNLETGDESHGFRSVDGLNGIGMTLAPVER